MYTDRYPTGYAGGMTELEKGPQAGAAAGARASASSARHSSCSAIRASTAPAWTNSARWPRCPSARPTSTSPARTNSSPNTCADSIPTSWPECSTAPTSRPANDSSPPSRSPRPLPPVPLHRGGRRNPRPSAPRTPVRTRLQESLRRAAHRNRPRSRRHQPRTARRTTGAAPRWRLGPHPSPQHRILPHRRRHRRRPHRQRHPHGSPAMTAELPGLLLFGRQVSDRPIRPPRPGRGRPW